MMINEFYVLALVKKYVNFKNELPVAVFMDITDLMDASDVEDVLAILIKNGISVVDDVEESFGYSDSSRLLSLSNEELCVMYQKGSDEALEALTKKNVKLIHSVSSRMVRYYKPDILTEEDLFLEGWIGFRKAAERFVASKGFKFTTYAMWWIKQAITRELMNNGNRIRIPVHVYEEVIRVNRCRAELWDGTISEICDLMNSRYGGRYDVERIEFLIHIADNYLNTTSLNTLVGEDGKAELIDFISTDYSVEDEVAGWMICSMVDDCLKILTEREKMVIRMRFGLDTGIPMTLEAVGNRLGVTRERIRQIEAKAIRKLGRYSITKKMEGMYAA
jgi:RNA polymerase primary sigma factor